MKINQWNIIEILLLSIMAMTGNGMAWRNDVGVAHVGHSVMKSISVNQQVMIDENDKPVINEVKNESMKMKWNNGGPQ